jgi:hypothetical protein
MITLWLGPAVELRLGKIRRGLAAEISLAGRSCRTSRSSALITPSLSNPAPQGLSIAADLRRERADRRPLRGVLPLMLEHYPNRAFANFRCVFRRCLLRHGSSFSRVGASGNPGAVQCPLKCWCQRESGQALHAPSPVRLLLEHLLQPLYGGWDDITNACPHPQRHNLIVGCLALVDQDDPRSVPEGQPDE